MLLPTKANGSVSYGARLSRSFLLTLAVGICFGFSFAYILLSVVAWEKVDLLGSNYAYTTGSQHGHIHNDWESDAHDHSALESAAGPSMPVSFHSHDESHHKGRRERELMIAIIFLHTNIDTIIG